MRCLVTGAAGFIGSHLCDRLLADGHAVTGLDCFTPYYAREIKEANLTAARKHPQFRFAEFDLAEGGGDDLCNEIDWVFHLAAMPGLARSWTHFDEYNRCNLTATHRLLDSLRKSANLKALIYASTSSVYGKYASGDELLPTRPSSPYGITKLAGEHLARVYAAEFGLPVTVLRFFSVYGPRQRPDMGYHQFIDAVLHDRPIALTGDGLHVRGNTYVADCVDATIRAAGVAGTAAEIYNLGGGEIVTILDVIRRIERITGKTAKIDRKPPRKGDQLATAADVSKLTRATGWVPTSGVDEGLIRQIEWQKQL
ncbi:MAG TPA: NAD-dependent epimerase/dehydratase family protein [Fimbriiglobus sp.]